MYSITSKLPDRDPYFMCKSIYADDEDEGHDIDDEEEEEDLSDFETYREHLAEQYRKGTKGLGL